MAIELTKQVSIFRYLRIALPRYASNSFLLILHLYVNLSIKVSFEPRKRTTVGSRYAFKQIATITTKIPFERSTCYRLLDGVLIPGKRISYLLLLRIAG